MNSDHRDSDNDPLKDNYDSYMEPFKHLEQINNKNKMIFNELLIFTNESFSKANNSNNNMR